MDRADPLKASPCDSRLTGRLATRRAKRIAEAPARGVTSGSVQGYMTAMSAEPCSAIVRGAPDRALADDIAYCLLLSDGICDCVAAPGAAPTVPAELLLELPCCAATP